ncbi:MAG: DNA primase, partial [Prevotellaceae bacterium]|nr:DNA primase [Prevotellaceae bacterium]
MEKISSQTIDRIKSVADIVDVVGDFVNLRKRGVNYVGLCPFHEDRSPSMCVSRAKQMYKCFACGEGGDVITFVMKIENLSYPQALHWLAKKYHIEIEQIELTTEEREADKQRQNLILINEQAQRIFSENLKSNIEQQNYLCKIRGIDADILKKYSAGFADGGNQLLQRLTQNLGQNADNLILTGVCGKSETSGKPYDKFQNRITFPFYSISGQIIGFTGRDILGKENTAKYLNTAETPLFTKGKNFFGLFQAKNAICKANEAIIVEGQFDVLSMVQKGFPNTICGSGTALTEEQAKLIHRFAEHATLIYDADTAGINASFKNCKTLLANNIKVKLVDLPAGEDPDTFAQKMDAENLKKYIKNHAKTPVQYFFNLWKEDLNDAYKKENALNQICDLISAVQEKTLKKSFINEAQAFFNVDISDIMAKFKVPVKVPDEWKTGFYGIEEAEDLLKTEPFADFICHITFSTEYFYQKIGEIPIILCVGVPLKTQIQQLRVKINSLQINSLIDLTVGKIESDSILALKELWRQRFHIKYIDLCENEILFIDYYIELYSFFKTSEDKLELRKIDEAIIYDRCVEMMSFAEPTKRTVSLKNWQQKLDLPNSQALTNLLKPYLAKNKDKAVLETQRLDVEADLFNFDPEKIPEYVLEDDLMSKTYRQSGFYPLLNAQKLPVAYMFKNQNGGGHTCVSDFYMIPLLHVYSKDQQANKRVIQLNHLYMPKTKYVEWQSSVFANFGKVQERLIDEGAYNFEGNLLQFKKIWKAMSYNFTICQELRVFGQQSEEFFAFSNAILHEIDGIYKVERMNELGVVAHREQNYYSPAFSNIYASSRLESDPYEQDRNLIFKEIHGNEQLSFEQWAKLMNDVYKVNDNGKWGTLFAILAAFRDYIYDHRKYFTSLFFIGPTGSGKTQIAESIRNLFMDSKTPSFNLNTGTDAAFFMLLERMRNIIIVMEEYNDNTISAVKFQGLKSATLDGEGKIKVKDVAN